MLIFMKFQDASPISILVVIQIRVVFIFLIPHRLIKLFNSESSLVKHFVLVFSQLCLKIFYLFFDYISKGLRWLFHNFLPSFLSCCLRFTPTYKSSFRRIWWKSWFSILNILLWIVLPFLNLPLFSFFNTSNLWHLRFWSWIHSNWITIDIS